MGCRGQGPLWTSTNRIEHPKKQMQGGAAKGGIATVMRHGACFDWFSTRSSSSAAANPPGPPPTTRTSLTPAGAAVERRSVTGDALRDRRGSRAQLWRRGERPEGRDWTVLQAAALSRGRASCEIRRPPEKACTVSVKAWMVIAASKTRVVSMAEREFARL